MQGMITDEGEPTPEFQEMISDTVTAWIKKEDELGRKTEFIVMAIAEKQGRTSYWGVIDVPNTPREDLYLEMLRRFYAAYRVIGEEEIFGFGIINFDVVLSRTSMPRPPLPDDHPFYH